MAYQYKAKVVRVIDGDTIQCSVDMGFYITLQDVRFRLLGINAPELKGDTYGFGLASKKYLQNLIEGKEITLNTYKADSFGRWLADVYYNDININTHLIENGFANKY